MSTFSINKYVVTSLYIFQMVSNFTNTVIAIASQFSVNEIRSLTLMRVVCTRKISTLYDSVTKVSITYLSFFIDTIRSSTHTKIIASVITREPWNVYINSHRKYRLDRHLNFDRGFI